MRLIVENRFALLALVLIGLTALFGVAAATGGLADPEGSASAETAPVESALRVCPAPQNEDGDTATATYATGPGGDRPGGGELAATENTGEAESVGESGAAGRLWSEDAGGEEDTVISADGPAAAGLEAAQTTIGQDDAYASEVRCAEPGISTWFASPGGTDLDELRLLLANPDEDAATANVDVYVADGPVYSEDTRGISVDAHGRSEVDLTELIQGSRPAAVHVRTNSGRVAASLFADHGGTGQDWVPPTTPPAKTHVVPAIPPGGGSKRLIIAAPGDSPATADVRLYTDQGRVEHDTLTDLSVPPAAGAFLSLEGPLEGKAGTAVIETDRPVVAGVAASRADGDDTAYTAAAPPLLNPVDGTAVVPANPEGTESQLVFAALEEPGEAVVTPVAEDGTPAEPARVDLEAGRTTVSDAPAPEGAHALTVEIEGDAPVYAGRVLTQETGGDRAASVQPLLPAPTEVALPAVEDSLTAIVQ